MAPAGFGVVIAVTDTATGVLVTGTPIIGRTPSGGSMVVNVVVFVDATISCNRGGGRVAVSEIEYGGRTVAIRPLGSFQLRKYLGDFSLEGNIERSNVLVAVCFIFNNATHVCE